MKRCPKCIEKLKTKKLGEVEVEECQMCKGIWLEKDELRVAKDQIDSDLNWLDFEIWKHEDKYKIKESAFKCPACRADTRAIDYGSTAIEIDYCPSCEGIWLDKDEFEKIIQELEEELLDKSFSQYIKATLQEAKEIINGPESFISEWKDFVTVMRMMKYRLFVENPGLMEKLAKLQKINPFK